MKTHYAALLAIVSLGCFSGCAYIEGRKVQPVNKPVSHHGQTINTENQANLAPPTNTNPAANASQLIAPITQHIQ